MGFLKNGRLYRVVLDSWHINWQITSFNVGYKRYFMNAYPFSIFKRADRSCYSVSFKDANGKYLPPVSSGKKTEKEAIEIAFKWLRDGIPQNENPITTTRVIIPVSFGQLPV